MLKVCVIVLWANAPNPEAVYWHEMAHCWGWKHAIHQGVRDDNYQAIKPPFWYRWLGTRRGTEAYFESKADVRKTCGQTEQFGCQWFELRKGK